MTNSAADGGREPGPSQVQSVDRAIAILYLLAKRGNAGVTEVAADLGVHKSTAFRLIAALEAGQPHRAGRRAGQVPPRARHPPPGGSDGRRLELPTESRPVCRQLAAELGEAVNVAILDSGEATNILQEYGTSSITGRNWIGQRTPLHATASGKVLLAWMDAVALKEFLTSKLHRYTPQTVTRPALLEAELAACASRAGRRPTEEFEIGLNAVAAPILDADRRRGGRRGTSGPATGSPSSPSRRRPHTCSPAPRRSAHGSATSAATATRARHAAPWHGRPPCRSRAPRSHPQVRRVTLLP